MNHLTGDGKDGGGFRPDLRKMQIPRSLRMIEKIDRGVVNLVP